MSIPSIVNWLNDTIDQGGADAALYVAELKQNPRLITIGHCVLGDVDQLEQKSHLGRLRYVTCADPEISDKRTSLSLKDCWLGEQFLLLQLSEYREAVSQIQDSGVHNYVEALQLPESGASRSIQ